MMEDRQRLNPNPGNPGAKPVIKAVPPHQIHPGPRDVQDRARIAEEVKGALDSIRKTAENWRTGMAGLATLVTATLLFKGHDSITDYEGWVRYTLGAVVLLSLVLAVVSLWLFLTAAYGRLRATSAQAILDAGGVDVYNVHLATVALHDLNLARILSLVSAGLLAAGLLFSWYGPSQESPSQTKIVVGSEASPGIEQHYCGQLKALDKDAVVIQIEGEPDPRRFKTVRLISLKIVKSC
jgi:hypothetical protein